MTRLRSYMQTKNDHRKAIELVIKDPLSDHNGTPYCVLAIFLKPSERTIINNSPTVTPITYAHRIASILVLLLED